MLVHQKEAAVSLDGNSEMVETCYGLTETENTNSPYTSDTRVTYKDSWNPRRKRERLRCSFIAGKTGTYE